MDASTKKMVIGVLVVVGVIVVGYAGYKLYDAAVTDATKRIRTGAKEGIVEGVGSSLNPANMLNR